MYKFEEGDIVVSVVDLPDVPEGSDGTVVHIFKELAYMVEFFVEGRSVVRTVLYEEIEPYYMKK